MNSVRSLERGLDILRGFGPEAVTLTVHDMARRAGMPRSSVYRFIRTLVQQQFIVEVDEDLPRRRYAIGPAILALARVALDGAELGRCAYPTMSALAERVGESVYLSVRQDVNAVCVASIEASAPLRFGQRVGFSCPLYAGTAKAILAFLDPQRRDRIIGRLHFRPRTARTIRTREELVRRLARISRRGCEISHGEVFDGTKAVGAPVFDEHGEAFAVLTVGAPEARISSENESEITDLVVKGAHEITLRLRKEEKDGQRLLQERRARQRSGRRTRNSSVKRDAGRGR